MAKAKEPNTRSTGTRTPGSRPTASRRPARTAPDAPSNDVIHGATATSNSRAGMSAEEIYKLIQETAYYKAKARGFAPGHEVQDWIEAEAEVRLRLENRA